MTCFMLNIKLFYTKFSRKQIYATRWDIKRNYIQNQFLICSHNQIIMNEVDKIANIAENQKYVRIRN